MKAFCVPSGQCVFNGFILKTRLFEKEHKVDIGGSILDRCPIKKEKNYRTKSQGNENLKEKKTRSVMPVGKITKPTRK